ncbi:MAG TPA: TetR family transcriptional regulator [Aquihabitans sp.]|jgi:AcrR family transcriptional regulator|nr:TetR family transcriptional regulator [Aquihabitans sp.]
MAEVNSDRNVARYNAPRRVEQAAATRRAIIDAAGRLFADRGYAGTTMAAIAAEARVAPKSVYALADKPRLLLLALDQAIVGNDEPVGLIDQPDLQSALTADPAVRVQRLAAFGASALLRLYPLYRAFEQAAAAEEVLAEAWHDYQGRRRSDVTAIVQAVAAAAPLRPGLTEERAVDTLWALLTWHPVSLLVEERRWTPDDVEAWLADLLTTLLLPPSGA